MNFIQQQSTSDTKVYPDLSIGQSVQSVQSVQSEHSRWFSSNEEYTPRYHYNNNNNNNNNNNHINTNNNLIQPIYKQKWLKMAYYGVGTQTDIEECIRNGININAEINPHVFNNQKFYPKTALEIAVYNGNYKYVRELLKQNCSVSLNAIKFAKKLCYCDFLQNVNYIYVAMYQELTFNMPVAEYVEYFKQEYLKRNKGKKVNLLNTINELLEKHQKSYIEYICGMYDEKFQEFAEQMNTIKNTK